MNFITSFSFLLAIFTPSDSYTLHTWDRISTCKTVGEDLKIHFNAIQNTTNPESSVTLGHYKSFFSLYRKQVSLCKDYWQEENQYFKESFFLFKQYFGGKESIVELEGKVCKDGVELENKKHKETLFRVYLDLASIWGTKGYTKKVLEINREVLRLVSSLFGKYDLSTATSYLHLGNSYYQAGLYQKALYNHKEAFAIFRHLAETEEVKLMVIKMYGFLVKDYFWLGDWQEIVLTIEKKKDTYIELLGKDHPRTIRFHIICGVYKVLLNMLVISLSITIFTFILKRFRT